MKRTLLSLALVLAGALAVAALDVPLRDGTLIPAASYRVTGSYVMIELPDGRQVAYDVNDVDLAALRAAEATAAEAAGAQPPPAEAAGEGLAGGGRGLKSAEAATEGGSDSLVISDLDVRHVRGSGVRGEAEQEEAGTTAEPGVPEGYQEGGRVLLNNFRVSPLGEGQWQVEGEVVNRNPSPALSVSVRLERPAADGGEPWSADVPVAAVLGPNDKVPFSHVFAAEVGEGQAAPSLRASVIWMQEQSRREPDYTGAGGVPHPSNLPLGRGGVTGADLRPTPIQ